MEVGKAKEDRVGCRAYRGPYSASLARMLVLLLQLALPCVGCSGAVAASLGQEFIKVEEPDPTLPDYGCVEYSAALFNPRFGLDPTAVADPDSDPAQLNPVRFRNAEFDGGGFWNPARPTHLTVPFDGLYAVRVRTNFELAPEPSSFHGFQRRVLFSRSGRITRRDVLHDPPHSSGYWPTLESNARFALAANDFVQISTGGPDLEGRPRSSVIDVYIRRVCD